ncbi:MAG: hypothetical protein M1813_007074 [Trichoglossum hirsutum]|nr:MAG: hypothetical protein M1813_007074 [Trichoglossum hirsutum]
MSPSILLSQFFLPLSAVSLGRFVISLDDPHQDFYDHLRNSGPEVTERVQTQYDSIHHSIKHQNFRDAVQSKETQKWIERTIDEGEDIYVVVAYHTLFDTRIIEQLGGQSAASGNLEIPVSRALTASNVVVPFTNITDPRLGGSRDHRKDEQTRFIAPGEQIYAVQYRKVRWRWFTSNKVDKMTLAKKAWWERYDRPRYLESESEDMIEVELEDEIALEGDRPECAVESGESYLWTHKAAVKGQESNDYCKPSLLWPQYADAKVFGIKQIVLRVNEANT